MKRNRLFFLGLGLGIVGTTVAAAFLYQKVQPQMTKVIKIVRGARRKKTQPETDLAGN
jgi:hypothetical protein